MPQLIHFNHDKHRTKQSWNYSPPDAHVGRRECGTRTNYTSAQEHKRALKTSKNRSLRVSQKKTGGSENNGWRLTPCHMIHQSAQARGSNFAPTSSQICTCTNGVEMVQGPR
eukprot:727294-Rhodomonas_salina.2